MKLNKILFLLLFIFFILLVGGFLSKRFCVRHPDIRINSLKSGDTISSPLTITGEAKGTWYFEADFPIFLLDENGDYLTVVIAQAQSDWMTEDFVPFKAQMEFNVPKTMNGTLIFRKDNPSGLPEFDDEFTIPVIIENN